LAIPGLEAARPGERRLADQLGRGMHGQDDDRSRRAAPRDDARGIDAVHARHGDIHDGHFGLQLGGLFDRNHPVVGGRDDPQVGVGLQQPAHAIAQDAVVVGKQDGYCHRSSETTNSTRVPLPGLDSMCNSAPTAAARSRMIISPQPDFSSRRTSPEAKPRPSSATLKATFPSRRSSFTLTLFASACFAMFWRASR
jgi:hypothetical protein